MDKKLFDKCLKKDIDFKYQIYGSDEVIIPIKNEAIKWIKANGSCGNSNGVPGGKFLVCGENGSCTKCNYEAEYLLPWIKHFFNITEEDLEDGR